MQIFWFFNFVVNYFSRLFGTIVLLLMLTDPIIAHSQTKDIRTPVNHTIIKSGKFMEREHLVIDLQSNVEWMRCSVGQVWSGDHCDGEALKLTQADLSKAIIIANDQMGPGWRLPTRAELEGLVCDVCTPVKIELDSFPNTLAEPYWTGEVNGFATRHIWTVNFMTGHTYGRFFPTQEVLARLVRDR